MTCCLSPRSRRLPCGPVPVPQAPSTSLTQSNPNITGQQHHGSSEAGTPQCQSPAQRCLQSQGPALSEDSISATTPGKQRSHGRRNGNRAGTPLLIIHMHEYGNFLEEITLCDRCIFPVNSAQPLLPGRHEHSPQPKIPSEEKGVEEFSVQERPTGR